MSPEQAQGKEADQRSDIFSFGVVLYEMVTGQLPFKGEHEAAVIHSIVNDTPEPLARYKAEVPDELQRIVDKALQKDVSTRYQSAAVGHPPFSLHESSYLCKIAHMFYIKPGNDGPYRPQTDKCDYCDINRASCLVNKNAIYVYAQKI